MFDVPVRIPDRISTLELSQIWLHKALQDFKVEPIEELPEELSNQDEEPPVAEDE